MGGLFYKKGGAILTVAAAVVIILLLCILLTFLTQYSSLKQKAEELTDLLKRAETDEAAKQELLEYRKTDKYVIEWAVRMGLIPEDVVNYVPGESNNK